MVQASCTEEDAVKHIKAGLVAIGFLLSANAVWAVDEVNWLALPADKAALIELDTQQVRAVRTAVRHCGDLYRSSHQGSPCVFTDVDRVMRQSEDAALRAYHFALPRSMRYDTGRNQGAAVKRVMEQRKSFTE